jgi:hypothetical protein
VTTVLASPFVLDVADGEPQELDDHVIARELSAGLVPCGAGSPATRSLLIVKSSLWIARVKGRNW